MYILYKIELHFKIQSKIQKLKLMSGLSLLRGWKSHKGYLGNRFDLHVQFMNHLNKYSACPWTTCTIKLQYKTEVGNTESVSYNCWKLLQPWTQSGLLFHQKHFYQISKNSSPEWGQPFQQISYSSNVESAILT